MSHKNSLRTDSSVWWGRGRVTKEGLDQRTLSSVIGGGGGDVKVSGADAGWRIRRGATIPSLDLEVRTYRALFGVLEPKASFSRGYMLASGDSGGFNAIDVLLSRFSARKYSFAIYRILPLITPPLAS